MIVLTLYAKQRPQDNLLLTHEVSLRTWKIIVCEVRHKSRTINLR